MELEGKDISFKYPSSNNCLLKDVNISLESGEVKGLVGSSGSGKSTLCKILAGYLKGTGEVLIDGKPVKNFQPIQLIFQHPELTMNPKWKMKKILNESWDVTSEMAKKFGIKDSWLNRWPNELSGGEVQRFAVVRALAPTTKFLIADEITTMLDAITQVQIWTSILEFCKERSIGVLVVSHDKKLVDRICDDVVYFDDINHI